MTLTSREVATAFWLIAILLVGLWRSGDARRSLVGAFATLLGPKLLVPLVLYVAWMVALVWVTSLLGLWTPAMLKDTLLWTVPGFALWVGAGAASSKPGHFRRRLRGVVSLWVLVGYYIALATFELAVEIVLQLSVLLLIAYSAYGTYVHELRSAKVWADRLLAFIGLLLIAYAVIVAINSWATADKVQALRDIALPVWLTLAAIPFVFALSLYATYEQAFVRMKIATSTGHVPLHAILALGRTFHLRSGALHKFTGNWRTLTVSGSFREALQAIRDQQAVLEAKEAAERKKADDLIAFAGVHGADATGRQLDRRQFKETIDSLERLANAHVGWYHGRGQYQAGLLQRFADAYARGLPADHGIEMKVSKDGQHWYAWRRTPSGWCFGIGAAGPPTDQRFYDGPEPPKDFPGRTPEWSEPYDRGPNWWDDDD